MARAAHSLTTLKRQINERFPGRDRASDGGIGDTAHAARKSDHNPVNGVFHAHDYDHDPDSNGLDCGRLWRELIVARDPRTKYLIFNGRIWFPSGGDKRYTGPNAHTGHLHISVLQSNGDSTALWRLPMLGLTIPATVPGQYHGMSVEEFKALQRVLNAWYPGNVRLLVDGIPGPATTSAVRYAQGRLGLTVDGIPGPITRRKLGL